MSTISATDILEKLEHTSERITLRDLYISELGFNQFTLAKLYSTLQGINETKLKNRFNITNQSLREFTAKLTKSGITEYFPQDGRYIIRLTHDGVLEYKKIREQLKISN